MESYDSLRNFRVSDPSNPLSWEEAFNTYETKVFIASGVRYDLAELSPEFTKELAEHHTGGQLSVAPEHVDEDVLDKMKKPGAESYERFAEMFDCASKDAGKDQHLVPYYISGHPGSTLGSMVALALYLKKKGIRPRQVQDFIPTPMSMATSMYHTGLDPFSQEPVYTAKDLRSKRLQKALLLYWDPAHHDLAREALAKAGRHDLIGSHPGALVPPARGKGSLSIHTKRGARARAGASRGKSGSKRTPRSASRPAGSSGGPTGEGGQGKPGSKPASKSGSKSGSKPGSKSAPSRRGNGRPGPKSGR